MFTANGDDKQQQTKELHLILSDFGPLSPVTGNKAIAATRSLPVLFQLRKCESIHLLRVKYGSERSGVVSHYPFTYAKLEALALDAIYRSRSAQARVNL